MGPAPAGRPPRSARRIPFWRELAVLLLLAAGLTVVIKAFAVEAFRIPSGSMQDTLGIGDRVLVNKLVYRVRGIDRGDVIVFSGQGSWDPPPPPRQAGPVRAVLHDVLQLTGMTSSGTDYVKRVIGLPGDRVSCCDARGPDHRQRGAAERAVVPVSGGPAVRPAVQRDGPAWPALGHGRPPAELVRLPLPR